MDLWPSFLIIDGAHLIYKWLLWTLHQVMLSTVRCYLMRYTHMQVAAAQFTSWLHFSVVFFINGSSWCVPLRLGTHVLTFKNWSTCTLAELFRLIPGGYFDIAFLAFNGVNMVWLQRELNLIAGWEFQYKHIIWEVFVVYLVTEWVPLHSCLFHHPVVISTVTLSVMPEFMVSCHPVT